MDSFSSPSAGSSPQISPDDFMDQLKTQLAQAYAEEFIETVRGKCFEKCISKPGSSLSGGESSCISRCVDRYIEATAANPNLHLEGGGGVGAASFVWVVKGGLREINSSWTPEGLEAYLADIFEATRRVELPFTRVKF